MVLIEKIVDVFAHQSIACGFDYSIQYQNPLLVTVMLHAVKSYSYTSIYINYQTRYYAVIFLDISKIPFTSPRACLLSLNRFKTVQLTVSILRDIETPKRFLKVYRLNSLKISTILPIFLYQPRYSF